MKIVLKKKNLKVLKSKELNAGNLIALDQTKMINGATGITIVRPTMTDSPVDMLSSVSRLSDLIK
ncbi:hypothetical protein NRL14_20665 [Pseudoalteromonas sp. 20-92]|uniref:hypothetical protein n=1 Tax=unclassified Pseudoalteromonas TaxID=194690 RepID=UPI000BBE734F|nr:MULTISPECIES: hypothetical protein [unclassified Pseudoalteromonas]ATG79155.1 hypothetical protein AOR04_17300 [Pseudoalteromonas sp. 1_2015MBL_MicDiv]MDQ2046110.1 hypothetical protein [Pseudoalteromonas sp. 20-92]